jgi:TonB family protein
MVMEVLIYIGKVSLYWLLFLLFYQLILSRYTFFVWNRVYLLTTLLGSLALPYLRFPSGASDSPIAYTFTLDPILIAAPQSDSIWSSSILVAIIYFAGLIWMSFRLYAQWMQIRQLLRQGEMIELEDCTVVILNAHQTGSFSFLKWIVINRKDYENDFDTILRHEMVHARQRHSLDILLIEVLHVVFWFNPILLLYKKRLQEVHEFLADSEAANQQAYAYFLLGYGSPAAPTQLSNSFFNSSIIKTRIAMIFKNRTSKWKLGAYAASLCMGTTTALILSSFTIEQQASHKMIEIIPVQTTPSDTLIGKVFTVVEKHPEFPGGIQNMYKFLGNNLIYPQAAMDANVTGTVFLAFIVAADGSIHNIEVLKGVGFGMDEEAIRVVSQFPKWKPAMQSGKAVNVKFNLPIHFQLDKKSKK